MKINYIKLENFAGIYSGSGKYSIEIDFTKVKKRNIMNLLQGGNGSGKTTLLSCLHPFSGTMDERNDIIIPQKDGYKEIIFDKDGIKYKICHVYKNKVKNKSIKSYISKYDKKNKEWVELNDNGTVGSFEQIVERELSVTPSFFVLDRIGSNVKNFVKYKPNERKNYLIKYLPDITAFVDKYKIVNDKSLVLNKRIKAVSNEIEKLDKEDNLLSEEKRLSNVQRKTKTTIKKTLERINKNEGILSTLDSDSIKEKYELSEEKINKSNSNIEKLITLFNSEETDREIDDSEFEQELIVSIKDMNEKENELKNKISVLKSNIERSLQEIENNKSDLNSLNNELDSYFMEKDLDEFKDLKKEYSKKIKDLNNKLESFPDLYKLDLNDEEVNIMQQFINNLQENVIFSYNLDLVYKCIDNFDTYYNTDTYKKNLEKNTSMIKKIEDNIKKETTNLNLYLSKKDLSDILINRPAACKIDKCSFISEALTWKDVDLKITKSEKTIKELKEKLSSLKKENEEFESLNNFFYNFELCYKQVTNFHLKKYLFKLFPDYFDDIKKFTTFLTIDKNKIIDVLVKELEYSHLFMDKNNYYELLKEVNNNIKILESKETLINKTKKSIIKYEREIIKLETEVNQNKNTKEKYQEEINELENKIETKENLVEYIQLYSKAILINNKYTKLKESLEDNMNKITELTEQIEDAKSINEKNEEILDDIDTSLEDVKYKIKRLKEFKSELISLNETYKNTEIVKKALSPTKGIPLFFVGVYLQKTRDLANELLDVAFNGDFYIDEFELTENNFFIKIVKEGGIPLKDVTLASQGEMALISLAISIAMMEQAMDTNNIQYNIPLLDECDKELDETRRRSFITIISKMLEKLNVEQSFIISHNKEFDSANVDLILFKEHNIDIDSKEFMEGKNIIKIV